MEVSKPESPSTLASLVDVGLPFLMTLFFLEGTRRFIVGIWVQNFIIMSLNVVSLSLLLAFLASILVVFVKKRLVLWVVAGSAICLTLCRVILSVGLPLASETVIGFLVVGSYMVFLPSLVLLRASASKEMATMTTSPIMLALAADVAIRTIGLSLDVSMTPIWFPVVMILAGIAIIFVGALVGVPIVPVDAETKQPAQEAPSLRRTGLVTFVSTILFGMFFFLVLAALSPSTVASWTLVHPSIAVIFILLGLTFSGFLLVLFPLSFWVEKRGAWELANLAAIVSILSMVIAVPFQEAFSFPFLSLLISLASSGLMAFVFPVALAVNLALVFRVSEQLVARSFNYAKMSIALGATTGMLLFVLLLISSVATYTYAYVSFFQPFRGAFPLLLVLPLLVMVVLSIPAFFAVRHQEPLAEKEA